MADVQHASLTGADLHEVKDIASADAGDQLIATGSGSGSWVNINAYAEVVLDLTGTLTRSFSSATAYTDFALDYIEEHARQFSYNDTTKELTYIGTEDLIARYSLSISIKRTDVSGSPELGIAIFKDTGSGFTEITSSRVARSFSGNDVGSMAITGLHTFSIGDKFKLRVQTDAAIDIELRNVNWSIGFAGLT